MDTGTGDFGILVSWVIYVRSERDRNLNHLVGLVPLSQHLNVDRNLEQWPAGSQPGGPPRSRNQNAPSST